MGATIAKQRPRRRRNPVIRRSADKADLTRSYKRLFSGEGDQRDADIVRTDLAVECQYFMTLPDSASHDVRVAHNARRAVFLRLIKFWNMSESDLLELEQDAREEVAASIHDGEVL